MENQSVEDHLLKYLNGKHKDTEDAILKSKMLDVHRLIIADFRLIKKWLLPKRGDKYIRILSRRNNFWLILHLLHIFMLIIETLNPRNKPILYAKLSKYESRKILFLQ